MNEQFKLNAPAIAMRGLLAIVFGMLALAWPGMTLRALVSTFAIFAVIDGVLAIFTSQGDPDRGWHIAGGVLGILAGALSLAWPGVTAITFVYVIAAWALSTGVAKIVAGLFSRVVQHRWWLVLSGALSLIFGVVMAARPGAGALGLLFVIGIYAVSAGITLIGSAVWVYSAQHHRGSEQHPAMGR